MKWLFGGRAPGLARDVGDAVIGDVGDAVPYRALLYVAARNTA